MSNFNNASLIVTPNAYKAGKLYSIKPTSGVGDLDVVRATTATYVGSDGLIKTALANEVRFDYTNGSCPSILVEPQRTNLALRSGELNVSPWTNIAVSTNASASLSPSGSGSFKIIPNTTNTNHYIQQSVSVVLGTTYTISFFAKADGYNFTSTFISALGINAFWDLQNGIAGTGGSIVNYGNGWYRCIATGVATITGLAQFRIYAQNSSNSVFAGNGIDGVLAWGAQLEAGANATSYIPTAASAVTRNADVISKTGISSLIGQTEGTIYFETNKLFVDSLCGYVNISESTQNRILIYGATSTNQLVIQVRINNVTTTHSTFFIGMSSNAKVAFGYKNGDSALYINGVKYSTTLDTINYNFPVTLSKLEVMNYDGSNFSNGTTKVCSFFKTRLTNTQLQQLTTL